MAELSQTEAGAEVLSQANPTEKQPVYELGFHLVPGLGEDGAVKAAADVRALLGDAEVISEQAPQKMTLAYTIERSVQGKREKYTESYFGWIKFASEREMVVGVQEKLHVMSDVLRYLLIETAREDAAAAPRRAVFASDRLEGEVIKKPAPTVKEEKAEVSQEELDRSLDALTAE